MASFQTCLGSFSILWHFLIRWEGWFDVHALIVLKIKAKKRAMHGALLVCLQCSDREGCNCLSLSPVRPQMQRKIDAQKALHSCSISSFAASIIKSGFYRLSNPDFPISWRWPAQSYPRWIQGKRLLLGLWWHHVCRTHVDCMVGQVIDNYSVAIHWGSMCSLFEVIDIVQQETTKPARGKAVISGGRV